ncbi:MAG: transposase [Planctomyces sp.]
MLRDLCVQKTAASATRFYNEWYRRAIHTKLEPMRAVAKSIRERLRNVESYCTQKITNAVAEGLKSKNVNQTPC